MVAPSRRARPKAAVCTDCHGSHEILPPTTPNLRSTKFNVPATCGQVPHRRFEQPSISQHPRAGHRARQSAVAGLYGLPRDPLDQVAQGPELPRLRTESFAGYLRALPRRRAALQEFGFPGTAFPPTWTAITAWLLKADPLLPRTAPVATACTTFCPPAIRIPPSIRANLDATCGKCHKGATQKFTLTPVHLADGVHPQDIGSIITRWVRIIYTILILGIIGSMFLHNFIIWRSKADGATSHAESDDAADVDESALAASGPADQLHHSRHYWLCAEVPGLVVCRSAGNGRALAQHRSPHRWRRADRGRLLPCLLSRDRREGRRMLRDITPAPKDLTDVFQAMRTTSDSARQSRSLAGSPMERRRSTGRWSGALR